ncbi:hypothetical protein GQ44DRAFT_617220 [Phaeosphaeriaceae sp. PMI808]|nr:hypothetical protein GQ44DRAFT_617220 [Phaeosphaeriaceae sp. PMI808]
MNEEFRVDPSFQPWGPLISPDYKLERITKADITVASIIWAATLLNAIAAIWQGYGQTKGSREPWKSVYVWMIWLELTVSLLMGLECYLHLLKIIPPSFIFYFTILFWWCIQVQLLLQIIINRIRVIVPDRRRSRNIMIGTACFVTTINISVFCIWIPSRLQISHRYHVINEYWDRTEKVLYLFVDAALNWYFLKTVKANLISNGLTKYNSLVRFNQRIVIVSLLMDVMIIAAMSIPNSFVYIQFHPLAYLVKLNIEMTMANLIKRIAVSTSRRTGKASIAEEFKSSNPSTTGNFSHGTAKRGSLHELASIVSYHSDRKQNDRTISFTPTGNQIKTTQEVTVTSEPNPHFERGRRGSEVEITGAAGHHQNRAKVPGIIVEESITPRSKSLDSSTEVADSVKSMEGRKRDKDDSDDEMALVGQKRGWGRFPS